jgi:transposase
VWYHSTRKAELDALARTRQVERALGELAELRQKLASPRTRYHQRSKVSEAVEAIVQARGVGGWIRTEIQERVQETYRQDRAGRPNAQTRYVREESTRFELKYDIDYGTLAAERVGDGVFPLITNDGVLSERELLLAYKDQPVIEKRFAQLKTDYEVAPVYLKEVSRIQALLCMYFFVLLVEALLERELRRAMARAGLKSLPLYPEGRKCHRPTMRRLIEVFDNLQRHTLGVGSEPPVVLRTELSELQGTILDLLGIPRSVYDR